MTPMREPRHYLFYIEQNYAYAILRPLQQAIRARGDDVAWFLVGNEIDASHLRDDEQRLMDVAAVMAYQPVAVFVPGNTVPSFIPGLKVEVFHGFNARKRSRGAMDSHFAIRGCFDLYCTQGPSTTEPFQQLAKQHRHFTVVETGWPKMDPLFATQNDSKYRAADGKPIVLLTSTFSSELSCAQTLLPKIRQLVAENRWHWLVQFHPKMSADTVAAYKAIQADNYQFIETDNVVPLLQSADVMVCDTSSILQEFLLLQRPVVTFKNRRPGPWLIDIDDSESLSSSIELALNRPAPLMAEIARYVAELHPYRDGKSAERVLAACDALLARGLQDLRPKPLNLVRSLKMRKKLQYWRP